MRYKRNYSVDETYFSTWSPNMAWILGYIWADGNIDTKYYTLRFGCTQEDAAILEGIRSELKSTHPFTIMPERDWQYPGELRDTLRRSRQAVLLRINSKTLIQRLVQEHHLAPAKSSKDLPFPIVPDEYLCHFARGNFDGDGSISKAKSRNTARIEFLGTRLWITEFQRRICLATGLPAWTIGNPGGKMLHDIRWCRKDDLATLFAWLYPPGDYLFLARKKRRYEEITELLKDTKPRKRRVGSKTPAVFNPGLLSQF